MSRLIDATFDVPLGIAQGLKSGALERVGGVIRESGSKKVVYWLRETNQVAGGTKLVVKAAQVGKALLAWSDFLYMESNFREIKKRLEEIDKKIDSQNIGKLKGGLQLAADAEKISLTASVSSVPSRSWRSLWLRREPAIVDTDTKRSRQLCAARAQLVEAAKNYTDLFEKSGVDSPKTHEKALCYLRLAIMAELAVARTYMVEGEHQLAILHLGEAEKMATVGAYASCKVAFMDQTAWWQIALCLPLLPIVLVWMAAESLVGGTTFATTDQERISQLIDEQEKAQLEADKALTAVLNTLKSKSLALPDNAVEMLTIREYIQGYKIENEHPEQIGLLGAAQQA